MLKNTSKPFETATQICAGDARVFEIPSTDGRRLYRVAICIPNGVGADHVSVCTCMAGQHNRSCKHVEQALSLWTIEGATPRTTEARP